VAKKIMSALERWRAAFRGVRRDRVERIIRVGLAAID
jgi:hypothetical protein